MPIASLPTHTDFPVLPRSGGCAIPPPVEEQERKASLSGLLLAELGTKKKVTHQLLRRTPSDKEKRLSLSGTLTLQSVRLSHLQKSLRKGSTEQLETLQ